MAGNVTRNRAGQIVKDTSLDLVSPLRALLDAGAGTVRGMTVGTLGAPAELLNLLRVKSMGGSDIPYNMEYWNKVLPSAGGSHDTAVGQALGEFVPLPNRVVMAPVKAVKAIPGAIRHGASEFARSGVPAHVIKPKGGNWLAGTVEEAIKPLKDYVDPAMMEVLRQGDPRFVDQTALASLDSRNAAINKWLEGKLGKYIRNEMGTPEDPLRELAGRGITHVPNKEDLMMSGDWIPEETARNRRFAGYPEEPTSTLVHAERGYPADEEEFARMAAGWENAADSAISPFYARTVKGTPHEPGNPWINKVDPETMVYQADRDLGRYGELGFPHLVDELKNAMDPASGLPRHLQLDPSKLEKITVPQASELVSKINAWRAEQKIAADAHKANNAATVLHKEYPEQGYKWVELRQPEAKSIEDLTPDQRSWFDEYVQGGVSPETALKEASKRDHKSLEEALKYEGETMGHCVGGYCPDVIEGRSRIFSLRDKKGEPHVTIEVKPGQGGTYTNDFRHWAGQEGYDLSNPEDLAHAKATFAAESSPQSSIIQIKGKANKKPKDEYLPFVQDFVRSGKWSDVGDIQNTGMRATRDVFSEGELGKLREAGETDIPHILSGEDIQRLHNLIVPEGKRLKYDAVGNVIGSEAGFAEGGLVGLEAKYYLNNNSRPEEFASGGLVEYNPAEIENAVARLREDMYA